MSGSNGSSGRYLVDVLGGVRLELRDIARRAALSGEGGRVRRAYAAIIGRLRQDAREFGEPMYHLDAMKMEVRKAAIAPLYIEYGVHDDKPVVVIRRVRWLGNPSG